MLARIAMSVEAGETWMARDVSDGFDVATVALDTFADPKLWTAPERLESAMFLHRLIVRRGWKGLGAEILDGPAPEPQGSATIGYASMCGPTTNRCIPTIAAKASNTFAHSTSMTIPPVP